MKGSPMVLDEGVQSDSCCMRLEICGSAMAASEDLRVSETA